MVIWLIPSPFLVHMVYEWPFEQMVLWSMDWVYQDTRRGTAVSGGLNLEVTGTKNTQKNPIQTPQGERKSDWSKNHFCGNMQRIWLRRTLIESVTNYPLFFYLHIGLEIIFTLKKVFIYTIAFYEQTTQMWHCIITIFFWQSFKKNT